MSDDALAERRILVVEDEYFLAKEMTRTLRAAGAVVLGPAPSQAAALALLRAERPDAALLDVNLRDGTVYPVADTLLERSVPFLFTTGYDRAALPERYAAVRRLEKPVVRAGLIAALERILT